MIIILSYMVIQSLQRSGVDLPSITSELKDSFVSVGYRWTVITDRSEQNKSIIKVFQKQIFDTILDCIQDVYCIRPNSFYDALSDATIFCRHTMCTQQCIFKTSRVPFHVSIGKSGREGQPFFQDVCVSYYLKKKKNKV